MRLLIITQKIDSDDPVLGFFHNWVAALSASFESVEVICLELGKQNLPSNVSVHSLGKDRGLNRFGYLLNFYRHLFSLRKEYDRVFVHMNQEYIILAGFYWRLFRIPVYFWRNHPHGDFLTCLSVLLSKKVFCTSGDSFTARYKKTSLMPVGIDTKFFRPVEGSGKRKYSICMVGRVDPVKNVRLGLEAVKNLLDDGQQFFMTIVGSPSERNYSYYQELKDFVVKNGLSGCVRFEKAVRPADLPAVYSENEICLNLTESGSFDKTIVEAAACGAIPVVSGKFFSKIFPESCVVSVYSPEAVARNLKNMFSAETRLKIRDEIDQFVKKNSLDELVEKLKSEIMS